jgi:hypothetical protein
VIVKLSDYFGAGFFYMLIRAENVADSGNLRRLSIVMEDEESAAL